MRDSVNPNFLVFCDIDHTLLNEAGDIPEVNRQAIEAAKAQGITIVLATARSYPGAVEIYRELELDGYMVVSNGTVITDAHGNYLRTQSIPPKTAREVFYLFRETPYHWVIRIDDLAHLHPDFHRHRHPFTDNRFYRPLDFVHLDETLGDFDNVVAISLYGDASMQQFYSQYDWEEMGLKPSYYPPSHYDSRETMGIISAKANKGEGAAWLQQHLGLQDAKVLALGDAPDDISMFALGTGIAPSSASGTALQHADWIGPSSDEGVVAAAFERFGVI